MKYRLMIVQQTKIWTHEYFELICPPDIHSSNTCKQLTSMTLLNICLCYLSFLISRITCFNMLLLIMFLTNSRPSLPYKIFNM